MRGIVFLLFCIVLQFSYLHSQPTFPYNGVAQNIPNHYVLVNARIVVKPGEVIERGSVELKGERIVSVSSNLKTPRGAVVIDLTGYTIYAGFIDVYSDYGMNSGERGPKSGNGYFEGPQLERKTLGSRHWNESIHPESRASESFVHQMQEATALRNSGFTVLNVHKQDGLMRGTSVLVALDDRNLNKSVLKTTAARHFGFGNKGSSGQTYPSSLMGNIALLRQTFYDAQWYATSNADERNLSLEAVNETRHLPAIFEALSVNNVLRIGDLAKEFKFPVWALGKGDEYSRAAEIAASGVQLIVPLAFPKPIDIQDPYDGLLIPLSELKLWELAPYNPLILAKHKIPFVFTAALNKDKNEFLTALRKTVKNGLPQSEALAALTTRPATILLMEQEIGTIEAGKYANLIVSKGDLFTDETSVIAETWVSGQRFKNQTSDNLEIRGNYTLNVYGRIRKMMIKGTESEPVVKIIIKDTLGVPAILMREERKITVAYQETDTLHSGIVRLSGYVHLDGGAWEGNGQWVDGTWVTWSAIRNEKYSEPRKNGQNNGRVKEKQLVPKGFNRKTPINPLDTLYHPAITYPLMAFGLDSMLIAEDVLIKNATVWTGESIGILQASILVRGGKIVQIGDINESVLRNVRVIDATGKHVTAGIIDEHSHIANDGGVNEGGQHVAAEVRLADVIDPTDINIYRQLAGGVTCSQILHGSANPVGGQSALIKLKWGTSAGEMLIDDAPGFIKFALGENVKQSNWGEMNTIRFPQTRMGVEQVFYDAFHRAREYSKLWKEYSNADTKKSQGLVAPRRDLELETLAEILDKKRFITCHSYVQSEIVMLMRVADSMGFTLNTFTHILEGYKVADKMKKHGAGASSFSDWWAYKYEVKDAIPHNAAVLNAMGIVTALNSDDAEMARRLNQEAAKTVKYGGVSEEDALKMVTLNPAILLHIDDRTGSIKVGKDADLVIWSGHPLSIYSKVEKTMIEGVFYYDAERDALLRKRDAAEHTRLIGEMVKARQNGLPMRPLFPEKNDPYRCKDN